MAETAIAAPARVPDTGRALSAPKVGGVEYLAYEHRRPWATSPFGSGRLGYVSTAPLEEGTYRIRYETRRPDGAHDLRTELIPPE